MTQNSSAEPHDVHPPDRGLAAGSLFKRGGIGAAFLVCWALIGTVMITAWIPMDWLRWYLPLIPIMALLQAFTLETVLKGCRDRWQERRAAS